MASDEDAVDAASDLGPVTQTLTYSGEPRVIARLDIGALVRLAQTANAVVVARVWRRRDRSLKTPC